MTASGPPPELFQLVSRVTVRYQPVADRRPRLVKVASVTDGLSNTAIHVGDSPGGDRRSPRHDLGRQCRRGCLHDAIHAQWCPGHLADSSGAGPGNTGYNNLDNVPAAARSGPGTSPATPGSTLRQPTRPATWHATTMAAKGMRTAAREAGIPAGSILSSETARSTS